MSDIVFSCRQCHIRRQDVFAGTRGIAVPDVRRTYRFCRIACAADGLCREKQCFVKKSD